MDPITGAALIGAGGNLLSGALGGSKGDGFSTKNYKAQLQFAQNSIRWRKDDAKASGIHPLFALGANPASFSPSVSSGGGSDNSYVADAANAVARGLQAKAAEKRETALVADQLETSKAQRELLRSQSRYYDRQALPGSGLNAADANSGKDTGGRVTIGPIKVNNDPSMPDAQDIEYRYGELPGWAMGALNMVADTIHTKTGYSMEEIGDWVDKNLPDPSIGNLPQAIRILIEKAYDHFSR